MVYDESGFDTTQSFLDKAAGARPTTHPLPATHRSFHCGQTL